LRYFALLYAYWVRLVGISNNDAADISPRGKEQGMIFLHCRDPPGKYRYDRLHKQPDLKRKSAGLFFISPALFFLACIK
jgi:hypothetical protein